jgi:hypothetical protein
MYGSISLKDSFVDLKKYTNHIFLTNQNGFMSTREKYIPLVKQEP